MNYDHRVIRRRTVARAPGPYARRTRAGRIARIVLGASLLGALPLLGQAPGTDVWLAPMTIRDGNITLGTVRNASDRPGYDNQPHFARNSRTLWFTSGRDGSQTELYAFDVRTARLTRLTDSPESEYSPTLMPGGDRLSTIVVERDSTQRLWSVPIKQGERKPVFEQIRGVGYHVWLSDRLVGLFLLGAPNALVVADVRTGAVDTVATNVGRSLGRAPLTGHLTFTQRDVADSTRVVIRTWNPTTKQVTDVATGLPGAADFAWTPGGRLLMASGTTLWQKPKDGDWARVQTFSDPRIGSITRLAVAPRGDWFAFVAAEPASAMAVTPGASAAAPAPAAAPSPAGAPAPAASPAPAAAPSPSDAVPVSPPPRPAAPSAAVASPAAPTTAPARAITVVVVRHGEKAPGTGDVPLSDAGRARAAALAATLKDAQVTAVFATPTDRTRSTALPVAQQAGVTTVEIPLTGGVEAHAQRVAEAVFAASGRGGTIVVVGHSNTVPAIVRALGGPAHPELCEAIYDQLFVLTVPTTGPRTLVRGTFGTPTPPTTACGSMKM